MGDRYKLTSTGPTGFGRAGASIAPNNTTDLAEIPKGVMVSSIDGGNVLRFLPVENDDADYITITGVFVGFIPPYHIRRVHPDTTCSVVSVLDPKVG